MLSLVRIYTDSGNFDRATVQLNTARGLWPPGWATRPRSWKPKSVKPTSLIGSGDRAAERRASLAGLEHAKRSGSSKWLELALLNLGDSYLKTRDFAESLKYSKEALPIMQRTNQHDDVQMTLFNEGLAYIGLGSIKMGEKLAEAAINRGPRRQRSLGCERNCCENTRMRWSTPGYLMMAIQVYHRYDAISEKFMTNTRQRAFLELSAQFDDERKARELELLRRDNELKVSEMHGQRLRQQLIIAAALFITLICAALVWAVARVSRPTSACASERTRSVDRAVESALFQRARARGRRRAPGRRLRAAGGSRSFQTHQRYLRASGRRRRIGGR